MGCLKWKSCSRASSCRRVVLVFLYYSAIIWAVEHNHHTQREKMTLIKMHPTTSTTQGWICLWGGSLLVDLLLSLLHTYHPRVFFGQHSTCQQSLQGPWCFLWGKTLNFLLTSNRATATLGFCPMWCRRLCVPLYVHIRIVIVVHTYILHYMLSPRFSEVERKCWPRFVPRWRKCCVCALNKQTSPSLCSSSVVALVQFLKCTCNYAQFKIRTK